MSAEHDIARIVQRARRARIAFVAAFIALAIGTTYVGRKAEEAYDNAPCGVNPAGAACQNIQREVLKTRSIHDTCIPFRRVGYTPCPKP